MCRSAPGMTLNGACAREKTQQPTRGFREASALLLFVLQRGRDTAFPFATSCAAQRLRIVKGTLVTAPAMISLNLQPRSFALATILRTAGASLASRPRPSA